MAFHSAVQFPPIFLVEPYSETIVESSLIGSQILTFTATDQDLIGSLVYEAITTRYPFEVDGQSGIVRLAYDNLFFGPAFYSGQLRYETIGLYPAQTFFNVDQNNGDISVIRNLRDDGLQRLSYTLRLIVYDTAYPNAQDTADMTITVVRHATGPIFQPSATNQVTIPETPEIGSVAINTNAIDQDGDEVTFSLVNSTQSVTEYYFMDPSSGQILVKRSLVRTPFNSEYLGAIRYETVGYFPAT